MVTGAAGFIAGYLIPELLGKGHEVVGIDNYSKYGEVKKSFENHPDYRFIEGDAKDLELLKDAIYDCDQIVAGAAIIGGISLFHEYAYDLLAENERITATAFDAAIWANMHKKLKKMFEIEAKEVLCTDVYINEDGFVNPKILIDQSDVIILAAGHKEYIDLRFKEDQILIDVWNYYGRGGVF